MPSIAPPSDWITRFSSDAGGPVLDIACGTGRHARFFLARGLAVTAADRDISGMADIADVPMLKLIAADLESGPDTWHPTPEAYATVVVANYLWRPLLPALVEAVAPGGRLLYETFALGNERFGKPSNPDFLLMPQELREAVADRMEVRAFEEGETDTPRPAVIQRIYAVKGKPRALS